MLSGDFNFNFNFKAPVIPAAPERALLIFFRFLLLFLSLIALLAGCGGSGGGGTPAPSGPTAPAGTSNPINGGVTGAANVLAVSVDGPGRLSAAYPDEPTVSVTICNSASGQCQSVDNILLDTGSYGLRIFSSVVTIPLPVEPSGLGQLAECQVFADNTGEWGPVVTATVTLGDKSETTKSPVPLQLINANFPGSSNCSSQATAGLDQSPSQTGYNGILGIGPFKQDCGTACAADGMGVYWSCKGGTCTSAPTSLTNQVSNPVAFLPNDYKGIVLSFPSIPLGGAPYASGNYLILGIGTTSNNTPGPVNVFPLDSKGDFTTVYKNTSMPDSFIDTGSNGLFFQDASIPVCTDNQPWYCPNSTLNLSAVQEGVSNSTVNFSIDNFDVMIKKSNAVFPDIGGDPSIGSFDWGLPFYFGRSVFICIEDMHCGSNTGPFFAY